MGRLGQVLSALGIALATLAAGVPAARAVDVRIAQQYGLSYLPLTVMRAQNLLQTQGKQRGRRHHHALAALHRRRADERGADLRQSRFRLGRRRRRCWRSGRARTAISTSRASPRSTRCRSISTPSTPSVKTIADFTDKDRIALPAVRVSIQADHPANGGGEGVRRGQARTSSTSSPSRCRHPDGMAAMMSGTVGDHRALHLGAVHVPGARSIRTCIACSTATTCWAARTPSTASGRRAAS